MQYLLHPPRLITACALLLFALLLTACQSAGPTRQALYLTCAQGDALLVYEIDHDTGNLSLIQTLDLPGSPGPLTLTDDGQALYVALRKPNRILPMIRDTADGTLTAIPATPVGAFPTYLDVDATAKHIVAASYGPGVTFTHALNPNRTLAPSPTQTIETQRSAHACLIDPTNRFVYIPHTINNEIYQFAFDADTGRLTPLVPSIVKGGGSPSDPAGPRHYVYHPDRSIVYAVNEIDSSVSAYAWDPSTGQLVRFQHLTTLPDSFTDKNTCADIHVTPDGRFLYASNRGHDSLAAYAIDADGRLTFIDWFETETWPREFAIDRTGRFLYAAGLRSDKLAAYAIDQNTGRLTRIATYDTPAGPIWVEAAELD